MSCGFRARAPGYARCLSPGVGGSDGAEHGRSGPGHCTELTRTPPPLPFPAGRLVSGSPCRWASPISKTISPTSPQKGSMFQRKPDGLLPQHSPCDLRQHKGRCLQTAPRSSLKPFPRKSVYIEQLRWGPKWHVFFDSSLFF